MATATRPAEVSCQNPKSVIPFPLCQSCCTRCISFSFPFLSLAPHSAPARLGAGHQCDLPIQRCAGLTRVFFFCCSRFFLLCICVLAGASLLPGAFGSGVETLGNAPVQAGPASILLSPVYHPLRRRCLPRVQGPAPGVESLQQVRLGRRVY